MTDKETLAKIITSHTVTWDQAVMIADSILDEGWGSSASLEQAREDGYDEAMDFVKDHLDEAQTVQSDLLGGVILTQDDLQAAREGVDRCSAISYSQYDAWVGEATLSIVSRELSVNDSNPFRKKKKS